MPASDTNAATPWAPGALLKRGVLRVFSGQAAASAVTFASLPVLAAVYAPADFAMLGIFSGVVAVVGVASSLSMEKVVPLVGTDRAAANAMAICLTTAALVSAAVAALIAAAEGPLSSGGLGWLAERAGLVGVSLLAVAWQQALAAWLVRRQAYRGLALVRVCLSVARFAAQFGLAFAWSGAAGLLVGFAIGQGVATAVAAALVARDWRLARHARLGRARVVLRRYRKYPLYAAGPEIAQRLSVHLPSLLLAFAYGYEVAGWYVLTQRLFGAPQTLLRQSFSAVFFGVGAREAAGRPDRVATLFRYSLRRLLAIFSGPYLATLVLAPTVGAALLDPAWRPVAVYCGLLAPMFYARFLWECLRPTIDLLGLPELHAQTSLMVIAALTLGILAPAALGGAPTTAIVGLSAAVSASQAGALWLTRRATLRTIPGPTPATLKAAA